MRSWKLKKRNNAPIAQLDRMMIIISLEYHRIDGGRSSIGQSASFLPKKLRVRVPSSPPF